MDAPRENLIRANFETRAAEVAGRTMTGYPIVFNQWTTINSWEGQFKERIAPGAMTRTLKNNGDQVKVLFNHGMDPSIGDKPLGKPTVMRADDFGLYTEVRLSDTSYNDDLIALMRDGALDGMSFRFSVVQEEWDKPKRGMPERTITEARLYEWGPVTFPAYEATTVGIRSRERYADWLGLDEDRRSQIEALMGIATDLRTLDDELDHVTSSDGLATDIQSDSQVQHSDGTQITRDAAEAVLARLRSHI